MKYIKVMTLKRTHFGKVYPAQETEYSVEVDKNQSISIFKNDKLLNTFGMGDSAEYDSYNLSYYGEIVGISEKSVSIKEQYGSKVHRLDMHKFCWRNYNFNEAQASSENFDIMLYI